MNIRSLRLAQIAAQAEGLRWRHRARRLVFQIVCVCLALPFLLAAFGFLEASFWTYVAPHFQPELAALIVMGGNLLVVVVLLVLAMMRGGEDKVSLEALEVRRRAIDSAQRSIGLAALMPVASLLVTQLRARRRRD